MHTLFSVLLIIVAIALIVVVLLQSCKSAGLSVPSLVELSNCSVNRKLAEWI